MLLVIFQVGFLTFAQGWPQTEILLPVASHRSGITGTCHHTWLNWLRRVLLTFYPGWSQTVILLISASQVAGITGKNINGFIKSKRPELASLLCSTIWGPLPCYVTVISNSPDASTRLLDFPAFRAMSQINPYPLQIIWSRVFCYSNRKRTKIPGNQKNSIAVTQSNTLRTSNKVRK
jgi:hypothetical protein